MTYNPGVLAERSMVRIAWMSIVGICACGLDNAGLSNQDASIAVDVPGSASMDVATSTRDGNAMMRVSPDAATSPEEGTGGATIGSGGADVSNTGGAGGKVSGTGGATSVPGTGGAIMGTGGAGMGGAIMGTGGKATGGMPGAGVGGAGTGGVGAGGVGMGGTTAGTGGAATGGMAGAAAGGLGGRATGGTDAGGRGGSAATGGAGGTAVVCSATTCPTGCCSQGQCITTQRSKAACGTGGVACKACGGCQLCNSSGACSIDAASRWTFVCSSAQLTTSPPSSGNNWDPNNGELGGHPPDPFCQFETTSGNVDNGAASTETVMDSFSATWNETITPSGTTISAATLMSLTARWRLWVGDDDGCDSTGCYGELACSVTAPMQASWLQNGAFTLSNVANCVSVNVKLVCQQ